MELHIVRNPLHMLGVVCVAGAFVAAVAMPVAAQRAHDADFYARLAIGPGHGESAANSINLAVHVNLWGWTTFSPNPNYAHTALNLGTSLNLLAYGAGVTWIWMPYNVYFSVAPGFAVLRTSGPDLASDTSDRGFAWDGSIGKEWWFSDTTAWGLAIAGGWHSARSPNIADRKWTGWSAAVRLSITTN